MTLRASDHVCLFALSIIEVQPKEGPASYSVVTKIEGGPMWVLAEGCGDLATARTVLQLLRKDFIEAYKLRFEHLFGGKTSAAAQDFGRIAKRAWKEGDLKIQPLGDDEIWQTIEDEYCQSPGERAAAKLLAQGVTEDDLNRMHNAKTGVADPWITSTHNWMRDLLRQQKTRRKKK